MTKLCALIAAATLAVATPALAELQTVKSQEEFMQLVNGKTLTRPLVRLKVLPNGRISGKGASWEVTGRWEWKGGYLCRSLNWGGDDLGYNCQEIKSDGQRMRITSDRGAGQSADFKLR